MKTPELHSDWAALLCKTRGEEPYRMEGWGGEGAGGEGRGVRDRKSVV